MAAEVTGGDLFRLWRVSEVHLPRVADVFYDANRLLGGSRGGAGTFRAGAPAHPGSSVMTSAIGGAWEVMRAELQAMTEHVGTTVLDAAQGVRNATQAYLDMDIANADLLREHLADPRNLDTADPASNPPLAGSGEDPGAPYPTA
ncbi:hypothetical protein Aph02nite_00880 [Actinoplanes philippinensis]|uniref:Uncharacterized protein n=1 Tax=Actinoplanes philippinensis TaxID=35752 RepID=A0A1I2HMK0_9ACTN|nr:hypothetical protein [Actinoplanes philippinensis]GIE74138.1 hypothetical protein Aph02nite_00880 [Actinoplanes philippinensis]SFF30932.1 hypothetical protein SAMN05421541_108349 [Actinoplanes philippinensis]